MNIADAKITRGFVRVMQSGLETRTCVAYDTTLDISDYRKHGIEHSILAYINISLDTKAR